MNESEAIEFRLRPGPRGLVRHAMIENAPHTFCGIDRSITLATTDAIQITRAVNCPACLAGAQRAIGMDVYLRRRGAA